ncbi:MAG: acyl carrier protein [Crocinitomicaceae bacterium]|nr:acyl carrier protein [Crocinitomicaceae bacterium]
MKVELSELRDVLVTTFSSSQVPDDISELKMNDIDEWDSLGNFNLLLAVESFYGVRFDMEAMASIKSVPDLLAHLRRV